MAVAVTTGTLSRCAHTHRAALFGVEQAPRACARGACLTHHNHRRPAGLACPADRVPQSCESAEPETPVLSSAPATPKCADVQVADRDPVRLRRQRARDTRMRSVHDAVRVRAVPCRHCPQPRAPAPSLPPVVVLCLRQSAPAPVLQPPQPLNALQDAASPRLSAEVSVAYQLPRPRALRCSLAVDRCKVSPRQHEHPKVDAGSHAPPRTTIDASATSAAGRPVAGTVRACLVPRWLHGVYLQRESRVSSIIDARAMPTHPLVLVLLQRLRFTLSAPHGLSGAGD